MIQPIAKFVQGSTPLTHHSYTYYKVTDDVIHDESVKYCLENQRISLENIDRNKVICITHSMGGSTLYIDNSVPVRIKNYERVI